MKATPEQFNVMGGERDIPLTYAPFMDSYLYQLEREEKKPVSQPPRTWDGLILIMEWIGIIVMFLIAGWVQ